MLQKVRKYMFEKVMMLLTKEVHQYNQKYGEVPKFLR